MADKVCKECGELKSHSEYEPRRKTCRKCRNIYKKEKYYKDRDKVLENKKLMYSRNSEVIKRKQMEYYGKNKDEINSKRRERYLLDIETNRKKERDRYQRNPKYYARKRRDWRKKNLERSRITSLSRYRRNPQKQRDFAKSFRDNNPEKIKMWNHRSRAFRYKREGVYYANDLLLLESSGFCMYCGETNPEQWHIDHIFPLVNDGTNWPYNLALSCAKCNRSKSSIDPIEWINRSELDIGAIKHNYRVQHMLDDDELTPFDKEVRHR